MKQPQDFTKAEIRTAIKQNRIFSARWTTAAFLKWEPGASGGFTGTDGRQVFSGEPCVIESSTKSGIVIRFLADNARRHGEAYELRTPYPDELQEGVKFQRAA